MFMVLKKKQMIMTAIVIMFAVAGYLNYRYDAKPGEEAVVMEDSSNAEPGIGETVMVNADAGKKETDFFAVQRVEKEQARSKTYDELKTVIDSSEVSDEAKSQAEEKLNNLITYEEKEVTAENMLKSKGFEEVMVHINDESITVNVRREGISRSDTAKIVDTIYELTQNNNIKIVEVN